SALARALEKEPDRRYQTGEQFAAELKNVLAELRASQPPMSATPAAPVPAPAAPPPAATPALPPEAEAAFGAAPPGEESSEWRLSEFLRLLHDFDTAAAQADLQGVRKAFVYMKKLETKDERFVTAGVEYGNRLLELEDRLKASKPPEPAVK